MTSTRGAPNAKLQLSNSYPADFDQLAQLLHAIVPDTRERIPLADLANALGLAYRQVENLGSIAQALGLVERVTYKASPLGRLVQARDPFFDDLGTLWFLHYMVSSDSRNMVWNRIVTDIMPSRRRLTRNQVRDALNDLRQYFSEQSIQKHVLKEVNTVLDAYTNQRLARLAFLRADGDGYMLAYREPVPALVLAASIARFRDLYRSGDTAVPVPDLLAAPNSPGVVLQLGEERLRAMLEELKTQPGLSLESRADLDQVRLTDGASYVEWMKRYYASR